ncbi:MAG: dihydroorotate dehydrogenase electron transfer subunit [Eubacteriales bacterium]|nr:dihydroorotate dehydrogenase electron transfer subunit [Eubacteriales bacterium]
MKFKRKCNIVSQESLGDGIFSMWLEAGEIADHAVPGQFVSLYSRNGSKILPRPISLCEIDKENHRIRLVYRVTGKNTGTEEFSKYHPGVAIEVLGPLGNGFPLEEAEGKTVMLIGGGIGVPPLLETAKQVQAKEVISVMGYRDRLFLKEEFEDHGKLFVATEDGSFGTKGNVINAIEEENLSADLIFACGPKPMLRALKAYSEEHGIVCYISMEERMACGIGACLGCVCQSTEEDSHSHVHNKRVCKDGPVFLSTEVEL